MGKNNTTAYSTATLTARKKEWRIFGPHERIESFWASRALGRTLFLSIGRIAAVRDWLCTPRRRFMLKVTFVPPGD
jgi:hypothetical protein